MGNKLVIVSGDGWEGIYCNSLMQDESHEIRRDEVIQWMKQYQTFDVTVLNLNGDGQEWMEDRGCLPLKLGDIPMEYFEG